MADLRYALWWMRHGVMDYDIYDDEDEAARVGVAMEDDGVAVVLGVQYSNGKLEARDFWPAYGRAVRLRDAEKHEESIRPPLRGTKDKRIIRDPFFAQSIKVDAGEPKWLGREIPRGRSGT